MRSLFFSCACALLPALNAVSAPSGAELLEDARRILFLGDSITYDGRYVAMFDAWLAATHPQRRCEVLNLGLPSETVSGLSEEGHAGGRFPRPDLVERLERVLDATRPDLVIACYGMNCGIYKPFDNSRFTKYQEGILRLRNAAEARGAKVVFVTPPAYDHDTGTHAVPDYNEAVLGAYAQWLLDQRPEGWAVVPLHGSMSAEIARRRASGPSFTLQPDGVHPNDAGHGFIACQLVRFFAGPPDTAQQEGLPGVTSELLGLTRERMALLRDAWLTRTGHERPGLPDGLPLEEAQQRAAKLSRRIKEVARNSKAVEQYSGSH